ncbi:MAG: hypothetical protein WD577_05450 [Bacteroidales bacterium]
MRILITFLVTIFSVNAFTQISFYVDEDLSYPDISVKIGTNVSYPDIRVQIGENISYDDLTIGVTNSKSKADFVIVKSKYQADKTIRASDNVSYPDIRIQAGESVSYPDIRIEIKKTGTVNYLVYTEKAFMSMNDLVIALLPVINKHLDYKFKDIPKYIEGYSNNNNSSSYSTNNQYAEIINLLRGASIIAQDDNRTFLGILANEINYNSIFNEIGTYGSDISSNSIWNDIGTFGSDISSYSPFNDITSTPPMIVKKGKIIGYLTVNEIISGGISPHILKALKDEF